MTRLELLYNEIDNSDITHIPTKSTRNPAYTLRVNRDYAIVMNERAFSSNAQRLVVLAHEKAHCDTGAVYSAYAPLITMEQCEARANKGSVYMLMPLGDLIDAFEHGITQIYELAEHFEVTEVLVTFALNLYAEELKRVYQEKHGVLE